jgi:hypothetical protein
MKASVRVMISYDYNHFEFQLGSDNDEPLNIKQVNELRKTAQRLADEAVRQYKKAKEVAAAREQSVYEKARFLQEIKRIEATAEADRSVRDLAMLKQYHDEEWEDQFTHNYDYDDDEEYFSAEDES